MKTLASMVLIASLGGCIGPNGTDLIPCDQSHLEVAEVVIPSSAIEVNCRYSHWMETAVYIHFRAPPEDSHAYVAQILSEDLVSGEALTRDMAGANIFISPKILDEMGIADWWVKGERFSYGGSRISDSYGISVDVLVRENKNYSDVWLQVLDVP